MIKMSSYEALSLVLAAVALLISCYALFISVRLQRRQIREIDEERGQREKADIRVTLERSGREAKFVITNVGQGTAFDINFSVEPKEEKEPPLVENDYAEKIPVEVLRSGDQELSPLAYR